MAQHGYLREYDEDRDRGSDWNHRDRERAADRNFMLGGRDDERHRDRDRGFFDRMGDRAGEMFGDDDRQYRGTDDDWNDRGRSSHYGREHGFGGFQGDYERGGSNQGGFGGSGDWRRGRRSFSANPDDHYRSWRDKQMRALDRDYEDYCREREQQFHQDFDSWRRNRQQQSQDRGSPEVLELNNPTTLSGEPQSSPSPMANATLGTNNGEYRDRARQA